MQPKVAAWFQAKLDKLKKKKTTRPQQFPGFSNPRPHVLTPSPSQECLDVASTSSPFFLKLPHEIRRNIIVYAFGGRAVHMALSLDHPFVAGTEPGQQRPSPHCGIESAALGPLERDYNLPKTWNWRSSVCHRNMPDSTCKDPVRGWMGPWADQCHAGSPVYCHRWPGDSPENCKIGAMGWLLSCRQAYAEGINVLYRTSIIQMYSEIMISRLSELLLPQRLTQISSLEVVWPIKLQTEQQSATNQGLDTGHFEAIFDLLLSTTPNLRFLYLSLQSQRYLRNRVAAEDMLVKVDQFVHRMPHLHEFYLALPESIFDSVYGIIVSKTKALCKGGLSGWHRQIWRYLDGELAVPQFRVNESPEPPERESTASTRGYWLVSGMDDQPQYFVCNMP